MEKSAEIDGKFFIAVNEQAKSCMSAIRPPSHDSSPQAAGLHYRDIFLNSYEVEKMTSHAKKRVSSRKRSPSPMKIQSFTSVAIVLVNARGAT